MINNLVGLCRGDAAEVPVYIHSALMGKLVDWLNENNPDMGEDSNSMCWKVEPLDAATRLCFKESDNFYPLVIDRNKIGYARSSKQQTIFQDLLTQVFPSRSLRRWRV
ncbi:hypothetical protein [uncultured Desulfuromusa sp.]|uniref:hypothetical protein n=1 Tax=uncultured Desulfuromusa sp. TaxID=219183 RepID=UPI002AA8A952|nr:hypothetical protein [uncultured Desulfuromusa sp.]